MDLKMAKGRSKKPQRKYVAASATTPPGFFIDPDGGLTLDLSAVPRSPLEILASGFRHQKRNNEILFLFGHSSAFDDIETTHFTIAVEISMSLNNVYQTIVDSVWDQPSSLNDHPMIESVKRGLTKEEISGAENYECKIRPPLIETRSNTLRAYQADNVSTYVVGSHGGLEFITIPSSLITTWRKSGKLREGDRVTSKLTVVLSRYLLYAFFFQVRDLCKDFKQ